MHSITILLSTYNGEKYLEEQIDSLLKQKDVNINIYVRDDGSTDKTREILDKYQEQGVLEWYTGPNLRPAKSFMNLIMNAPNDEYYAFCDQDDIWNVDKLKNAVDALAKYNDQTIPHLYCANYQLVDANLNNLPDNGHVSTTTFEVALISSCCTGCTVVFNKSLLDFLRLGEPETIVMHDDWCHKVCLAVGGTVDYDSRKVLKYRQHGNNVDGGVHSLSHRLLAIIHRIINQDKVRSKQLIELYSIFNDYIEEDKKARLKALAFYDEKNLISRILYLLNHRTGKIRTDLGFWGAVIFKYF